MVELHSGFKLLGNISGAGVYKCEGMIDPTNDQDYATKNYVDSNSATAASMSGVYLYLSGANANQTINIGSQKFQTTGNISGGRIYATDFYPGNISFPLADRFVNQGITATDHFRSGVIPTGYAWAGSFFATPNGVLNYSYQNDYLRSYFSSGTSGAFLCKNADSRNTFMRERIISDSGIDAGIRIDDNTNNNFYELKLYQTGSTQSIRLSQKASGASIVNTDVTIQPIGAAFTIMLFPSGSGNHTPYGYLVNEVGQNVNILAGSLATWTPIRSGLVSYGTGAENVDWFFIT